MIGCDSNLPDPPVGDKQASQMAGPVYRQRSEKPAAINQR
jgi:hypothetical protein